MMKHKITFGLYYLEKNIPEDEKIGEHFEKELNNIKNHKNKFDSAAKERAKELNDHVINVAVIISVLLVPDWNKKSDFKNRSYRKK